MPLVIETFFESLFTGRIIFMILFGLLAGYFLGYSRSGPVGMILWGAGILFVQLALFATSDYIKVLARIGSTGSAGFKVGDVFMIHFILHPSILAAAAIFGWHARGMQDEDHRQQAVALTVADFEQALRVLGSHPDLASAGWFEQRWARMDQEAQLEWIGQHLDALRTLWLEANGEGLQAHGRELPMRLASIDTDAASH